MMAMATDHLKGQSLPLPFSGIKEHIRNTAVLTEYELERFEK